MRDNRLEGGKNAGVELTQSKYAGVEMRHSVENFIFIFL
jgi:hypothetical protein